MATATKMAKKKTVKKVEEKVPMIKQAPLCYTEISVPDVHRASKFYSQAFGWQIQMAGDEYAMFQAGKECSGGLQKVAKVPGDGPFSVYIMVDDINATAKKVETLGGKTVKLRTPIMGGEHGYFGQVRDPFGNLLGLWTRN